LCSASSLFEGLNFNPTNQPTNHGTTTTTDDGTTNDQWTTTNGRNDDQRLTDDL